MSSESATVDTPFDVMADVNNSAGRVKRVLVLFSRLSGYMATCLKALATTYNVELLVVRRAPLSVAPFEERHFNWIERLYNRNELRVRDIEKLVEAFDPQAVLMAGWMDKGYLHVAKKLKSHGVPVVAGSDTQWTGSLRQQLGRVIYKWHIRPSIDVLWVSGERQRQLAYKLGVTGEQCWSGYYTCDWERFAEIYKKHGSKRPRAFLYVGRYLAVKGLDVLVNAYAQYRKSVPKPWPLICVGAGPDKSLLDNQEGIVDKGFVQPDELPDIMGQACAFVLASRREPWGVVVHEAAAAGMPLLCSDASGAAVHLLRDQYNGILFSNGNSRHLASGMTQLTNLSSEELELMSERSHMLSHQYTPQRWATVFYRGVESLKGAH